MEKKPWRSLKDSQLLEKRITEFGLEIEHTALEPLIRRLYGELNAKGLVFHPACFLADEWFVPVGIPAIGIPFYLSDPRLRRMERTTMLEVEGGTVSEFMKLIRHETAHAYSYAYGLYKKTRWRKLFGLSSQEYDTETYDPKPYSRSYVVHLENWYAQSHPDEDFAETFAVWLKPGFDWRKRYRNWKGALEKLSYVDSLMKSLEGRAPANTPPLKAKEVSGLAIKLSTYYKRKKKIYEEDYPDFYDRDLTRLFTSKPEERGDEKASRYLRRNYDSILKAVCFWTNEKRYTADQLMRNLIPRCNELNLYVRKGDNDTGFQVASYITTLISNHLFTGKFKRSK